MGEALALPVRVFHGPALKLLPQGQWPSQSFPFENQLPSSKTESSLMELKPTASCLILCAHGEQIVPFGSEAALDKFKDSYPAPWSNTGNLCLQHQCNVYLKFPYLGKHSSFFSGQRTAENDLMSSETKKCKSRFNEIRIGIASVWKQPPFLIEAKDKYSLITFSSRAIAPGRLISSY